MRLRENQVKAETKVEEKTRTKVEERFVKASFGFHLYLCLSLYLYLLYLSPALT